MRPFGGAASLRETLYAAPGVVEGLSGLAAFLFTHNAQIAIMAFALGFAFCLPAGFMVLTNGLMLGAFIALPVIVRTTDEMLRSTTNLR